MTPRNVAETAFLVAGVYFIAASLPQAVVGLAVALGVSNADPIARWTGLIGAFVTIAVGVALVALRGSLSRRFAPESPNGAVDAGMRGPHAAAISLVGIWFLATGLAGLLRELFRSAVRGSAYGGSLSLDSCAGPTAETLVGLVLFLASRGIVGIWHMLRSAGRHPSE